MTDGQARVLIVDDHAVVAAGVRSLLAGEPRFAVGGEARTLAEAVRVDFTPDIIITDLMLDETGGVTVVEQLREAYPSARLLVLTMIDEPALVRASIAAGADGYILKGGAPDELLSAVAAVAAGMGYVDPALGARVLRLPPEPDAGAEGLTERERDVAKLLALGHTNSEAAALLNVSIRTVESHRAHLFDRLGLKTRAELVRWAIADGLLDDI